MIRIESLFIKTKNKFNNKGTTIFNKKAKSILNNYCGMRIGKTLYV